MNSFCHTLSWAPIQTVLFNKVVFEKDVIIKVIRTIRLLVQAKVIASNGHIRPEINAITPLRQKLLKAKVKATRS